MSLETEVGNLVTQTTALVATVTNAAQVAAINLDVQAVTARKNLAIDTEIPEAIETLKAFTSKGAWTTNTAYAIKDLVSNEGDWYVCVMAHVSSPAFATDTEIKWRIYQGVTSGDLGASSGSSLVGNVGSGAGEVASTVAESLLKTAVNIQTRFGVLADGTNEYVKIKAAWDYCLLNGKSLYMPAGNYNCGTSSFPFRQPESFAPYPTLLDCKGITVFGDGDTTLLFTASVEGADVLQLNAVKRLTIRNLAITATVLGNAAGSNGISITNGFDELDIDVTVKNMPRIDKGTGIIDGGGALSIQTPNATQTNICGTLRARILAEGCYYGFLANGFTDVLAANGNNQSITVDLIAKNCCIGVFEGYTTNSTYLAHGSTTGLVIRATTIDCQIDYFAPIQSVGSDIQIKVITSKSKAARLLDPFGVRWDSATLVLEDTIYSTGQLCVAGVIKKATNSTIKLTGDKGACDYKAAIGTFPGGQASAYNDIYLDLGGTAVIAPVLQLNFEGNCFIQSTLQLSNITSTSAQLKTNAPSFFENTQKNRIMVGGQVFGESGTFTPILMDDGVPSNRVAEYITQRGTYSVNNGWVHFNIYLIVNSLGGLITGNVAFIGGLPHVTSGEAQEAVNLSYLVGTTLPANNIPTAWIPPLSRAIRLGVWRGVPTVTSMTVAEFSATGGVALSGSYPITY